MNRFLKTPYAWSKDRLGDLTIPLLAFLWLVLPQAVAAQALRQEDKPLPAAAGWYVGLQGGMPFGVSTFASFGADKARVGFDVGLYGGYRFSPVLSAETSMRWGKTVLSLRDCCADSHYWLGSDGVRYLAPVAGMDGWDYAGLKSTVALQYYGLQLNVNLLGLFDRTRHSRWTFNVSPVLAAVGTQATLWATAGDAVAMRHGTRWHLGYCGSLQAACQLTEHMDIGLYTGITCLTGSHLDAIPKHVHRSNYIWESGLRVGWTFGKAQTRCRPQPVMAVGQLCDVHPDPPLLPVTVHRVSDTVHVDTAHVSRPAAELPHGKVETDVLAGEGKETAAWTFPTIYFAFNRTAIAASEVEKMECIRMMLAEHADVHILVTGWCDSRGSKAVNDRISLQRARSVKAWLVRHGIGAARIHTQGMGIDHRQPDAAKARRAEIVEQGKEVQR